MQLQNDNYSNRTKKVATRGLLLALAMVLSWVESQIPVFAAVPGMKLGLTNLVVMVALYKINEKEALVVNMLRILLVSLTFGNMFSWVYSMAGGMLSTIVMILLKKKKVSMTTVSVMGGISHNVGQIIVAMLVMRTSALMYYLAVLWISGIVAGAIVGMLCSAVIKRLK